MKIENIQKRMLRFPNTSIGLSSDGAPLGLASDYGNLRVPLPQLLQSFFKSVQSH